MSKNWTVGAGLLNLLGIFIILFVTIGYARNVFYSYGVSLPAEVKKELYGQLWISGVYLLFAVASLLTFFFGSRIWSRLLLFVTILLFLFAFFMVIGSIPNTKKAFQWGKCREHMKIIYAACNRYFIRTNSS